MLRISTAEDWVWPVHRLDPFQDRSCDIISLGLSWITPDRSEQSMTSAQPMAPNSFQSLNAQGNELIQHGELEEAVARYREALRLKPDSAGAHNHLGNALAQQGELEEAVTHYREALRLKPDFAEASLNLADLLVREGKPGEAVETLRQAIRLRPNDPELMNHLLEELDARFAPNPRVDSVLIEVSPGELIDKMTILEIKQERFQNAEQLRHVRSELARLKAARDRAVPQTKALAPLAAELKEVNERLWDIENAIRRCEGSQDYGPRFIDLARSVYRENDRRASLKREINRRLGSSVYEQKLYQ